MFKGIAILLVIAYVYMLFGLPDSAEPLVNVIMYGLGGWKFGELFVWVWKRDEE